MPSWESLWDDFVQEELQVGSVSSSGHRGGKEDTIALVAKGKKKKINKRGPKEGDKKKGGEQQQRDMSKVKCFACHKFGHYIVQFPNRWLFLWIWRSFPRSLRGSSLLLHAYLHA